jgi:hypothetical protein
MSAAVVEAERVADAAWEQKRTTAEVVALLVARGLDAGEWVRRWEDEQAWWVEAAQQVRDVWRLERGKVEA